ncbi:MAG: PilN domain-containing protein [Gemmatimonadales bacterium]
MMITVNLRPGQRRKTGSASKQFQAKAKDLLARIKEPLLIGAAAAWILVAGLLFWLYGTTTRELVTLAPRLEQARSDEKRFRSLIQQKRKSEQIRDSLLSQIRVIRRVDGDRYIWPHLLDEVAKALPPYTWLVNLAVVGQQGVDTAAQDSVTGRSKVQFELEGRTVDYQAFTQFLRQLEASPWVSNVQTVNSQTVVESARPVTAFTVRATFEQADSAYVRTVPLNQSVR